MTPTLLALSTLVLHNREREGCAAGLNASDAKNSCGKSQWNAAERFCVGQLWKSVSIFTVCSLVFALLLLFPCVCLVAKRA